MLFLHQSILGFRQLVFVDVKKSDDNCLVIPMESFRLGLWIPLCPDLLHFYNSCGICPVQPHPIGWSFLICLYRLKEFLLTPNLFSQIFYNFEA